MAETRVGDHRVLEREPVVRPPRQMALYETHELISQLRPGPLGAGQTHFTPSRQGQVANPTKKEVNPGLTPEAPRQQVYQTQSSLSKTIRDVLPKSPLAPKSQPQVDLAEEARREARVDLKRKRQAMVTPEKKHFATKPSSQPQVSQRPASHLEGLAKYAQRLRQEDYILAELPKTYEQPANPSAKGGKKNSYDFLKRSQIYNHRDNQLKKERQIAQELNLSRLEE